jgi:glutamyl-tRNA synthetase
MEGIESKHRNRPVEESLAVWKEMVAGTPAGLANCMRFKISMSNLNKAMRDPVAYRCNLIPHIRTGSKYKVSCLFVLPRSL